MKHLFLYSIKLFLLTVVFIAICLVVWDKLNTPEDEDTLTIRFFNSPEKRPHYKNRVLTKSEANQFRSIFKQLTPEFRTTFKSVPDFYTIKAVSPDGSEKFYTIYLNDGCIYPGYFIEAYTADAGGIGALCYRLSKENKELLEKIVYEIRPKRIEE